jgi:hypothetical protein
LEAISIVDAASARLFDARKIKIADSEVLSSGDSLPGVGHSRVSDFFLALNCSSATSTGGCANGVLVHPALGSAVSSVHGSIIRLGINYKFN